MKGRTLENYQALIQTDKLSRKSRTRPFSAASFKTNGSTHKRPYSSAVRSQGSFVGSTATGGGQTVRKAFAVHIDQDLELREEVLGAHELEDLFNAKVQDLKIEFFQN